MQSTGEKIKKIRIYLGLNQEDFGKLFSVGKAYISQCEKDISKLSYGNLVYLLLNYKINLNWLLNDEIDNDIYMFTDIKSDNDILDDYASMGYATKADLEELKKEIAKIRR